MESTDEAGTAFSNMRLKIEMMRNLADRIVKTDPDNDAVQVLRYMLTSTLDIADSQVTTIQTLDDEIGKTKRAILAIKSSMDARSPSKKRRAKFQKRSGRIITPKGPRKKAGDSDRISS